MSDIPAMKSDNSVVIKIEVEAVEDDDEFGNNEPEEILPEMMVSVQVEEVDDQTLDFTSNPNPTQSSPGSRRYTLRRRKGPETSVERKERLERDRERKSWARRNETPEQRKARLDYHKKYKRKSRAKPKEEEPVPNRSNNVRKCDFCSAKFNEINEWQEHIKTHPWKEDHSGKIRRSVQTTETDILDLKTETESIVVKVEPVDYDDESNSSINESQPTIADVSETIPKEDLPYPIQCAIVSKMFKGRPISDICKLYKVTAEVVNELWEDRAKYKIEKPGRIHRDSNAKVEEYILQWMQEQKDNHIQISGKMIQNAAEAYARDLGIITFDGSRKWLDRFKKKHQIIFGTRNRDYKASDNKVKTQFFVEQWADARKGFQDDDIYIADEVGLFYNASKNRIQKLRGKKFVQGCMKDRLSIFLCANASGTDKKKLLVCGSEDPLINSRRDPQTLPVLYVRHARAHFTTRIFENYVTCWNNELEQCDKKVLLILDRATIHTKLQLSHLKLLFVPYKSKNSLVPIRHGVFSRFRQEFKRLILQDKVMKCMSGLDRNITCLEALNMLEKAWERVPPEVINNSLYTIGYDVTKPTGEISLTPKATEEDEETMCEMLKNYNVEHYYTDLSLLDEYLTVDDDLLTGQGTNPSVFGGNHKTVVINEVEEHLPIGTGNPESEDIEAAVEKERALQDLEIVKNYLQSKETHFGTYCAFMDVEKFVTQMPNFSKT